MLASLSQALSVPAAVLQAALSGHAALLFGTHMYVYLLVAGARQLKACPTRPRGHLNL